MTVGSQTELAGSMLSGFVVLHRSSSDVGDEQEGARECFLPSSFFFLPRFWRPVESEIPNTRIPTLSFTLFPSFLSLSLISFPSKTRYRYRKTSQQESFLHALLSENKPANSARGKYRSAEMRISCYSSTPRGSTCNFPSLLLSLFLFLYVFIVIN